MIAPEPAPSPPLAGASLLVVLHGGRSSEREVSIASGRALEGALTEAAQAGLAPPVLAVEIARSGAWIVADRALEPHEAVRALPADALYFLGLHGGEGEDGRVQAFLEVCGRRYTGSGVAASALCMDKHLARLAFAAGGIRIAPAELIDADAWRDERAELLRRVAASGAHGWFVKPRCGGSSVGVGYVARAAELAAAIEPLLAGGHVLVEACVSGIEATCAVLGNRGGALRALPPVEIRPRNARFFDYREKYDAAGAVELCPPESLSPDVCARIAERALRVHRLAGCEGYSRTDFIVPIEEGREGEPVALEVNTLPGMTPRSLAPLAAQASGMSFRDLCLEIARLGLAVERGRDR